MTRRSLAGVSVAVALVAGCGGGGGGAATGGDIFDARCATCHGDDAQGLFGPALTGVGQRLSRDDTIAVVTNGRNRMPGFGRDLDADEIAAVVDYVRGL